MTNYVYMATVVCSENVLTEGNQLALALGESAGDDQTFSALRFEAAGHKYAVSNASVTGTFQAKATGTLTAPAHAPIMDLTDAQAGQSALYIYGVDGTDGAAPGRIWAMLQSAGSAPSTALTASGVTRIPSININTADSATLQTLTGVGPTTAQAIIDGRTWNDPVELEEIAGITAQMIVDWQKAPGVEA